MGFTLQLFLGLALVLTAPSRCATKELTSTQQQPQQSTNPTTILTTTESSNRDINKLIKNEIEKKSKSEQREKITSFNHNFENSTDTKEKTASKNDSDEKSVVRETSARALDVSSIERFTSDDFQNKNNVYTLPESSSSVEKFYKNEDFDFLTTEHPKFEIFTELTTPRVGFYDKRFKETVDSVAQNLEHHFNIHDEGSLENLSSEEKNIVAFGNKNNGTKVEYLKTKDIQKNETADKNAIHKDLVVEQTRHIAIEESFNDHKSFEDPSTTAKNDGLSTEDNAVKSSLETQGDSSENKSKNPTDNIAIASGKSTVVQTTEKVAFTKPPNNKNNSHILSNNIESETLKAINVEGVARSTSAVTEKLATTTENSKTTTRQSPVVKSESLESKQRENQIVPYEKTVETVYTITSTVGTTPSTIAKRNPTVETTTLSTANKIIATETSTVIMDTSTTNADTTTPTIATETTVVRKPSNTELTNKTVEINDDISEYAENITTESIASTVSSRTGNNSVANESFSTTTESLVQDKSTVVTLGKEPSTVAAETTFKKLLELSTSEESKTSTVASEESKASTVASEELTSTVMPTTLELSTTTEYEITTLVFERESNRSIGHSTKYLDTTEYDYRISKGFTIDTEQNTSTEHSDITSTELPRDVDTTTVVAILSDATDARDTSENAVIKEHVTTSSNSTFSTAAPIVTTTVISVDQEHVNSSTNGTVSTAAPFITTSVKSVEQEHVTIRPNKTTSTVPPIITTTVKDLDQKKSSIELRKNVIPKDSSSDTVVDTSQTTITTENDLDGTVVTTTEDYSTNEVIPTEDGLSKNEDGGNKGTVAAIAISSVGAVCLVLLAGLLYIMRKRQKRFNYGPRCTPVSLDQYSIDNLSVYNSVSRRKATDRLSKRSYGNAAFDDPSGVSHPLNFPALVKFSRNIDDIKAEFDEVPQITARTSELPEGCETKNRYANVIPLPESRVFLNPIEGYANSDYINANYVTGPKNTKGYYIATQAPMENTVDDFWRMIWEQQCKVILMLTQHFENGLEKCVDYIPPSEVSDCHRLFGDFQVTLKKRDVKEKYIISSLQLKNMVSNSWREVTHFWYLGWPEKGVPTEGNSLIAFLIEARSYMKSSTLDNKKEPSSTNGNIQNGSVQNEINPVVVHCSPGTGRTGVVIACDIAIREFEKSRLVDVPKIVYKIRRDRASAVQTKEQYQFIYKVVSLYAMKLTGEVLDQ